MSTMRRATRLMASASASEEPPYFCTTMPTVWSSRIGVRSHGPRSSGAPAGAVAGRPPTILRLRPRLDLEHLIGDRGRRGVGLEVGVEPVVRDHGQQGVERGAGQVAPVVDVGELPPPQGLVDVAGAEVAQAVLEVDGDRG